MKDLQHYSLPTERGQKNLLPGLGPSFSRTRSWCTTMAPMPVSILPPKDESAPCIIIYVIMDVDFSSPLSWWSQQEQLIRAEKRAELLKWWILVSVTNINLGMKIYFPLSFIYRSTISWNVKFVIREMLPHSEQNGHPQVMLFPVNCHLLFMIHPPHF